ncbi:hypothetical protein D9M73_233990 [compost metagenome]
MASRLCAEYEAKGNKANQHGHAVPSSPLQLRKLLNLCRASSNVLALYCFHLTTVLRWPDLSGHNSKKALYALLVAICLFCCGKLIGCLVSDARNVRNVGSQCQVGFLVPRDTFAGDLIGFAGPRQKWNVRSSSQSEGQWFAPAFALQFIA